MLDYDYEEELERMEKLCTENKLEVEVAKAKFPVIFTVKPSQESKNQMMMNVGGDRDSFVNGEIRLIFADELTMQVINDYTIEDSLLNRLKNMAKKLHYIYLQMYFKEKTKLD